MVKLTLNDSAVSGLADNARPHPSTTPTSTFHCVPLDGVSDHVVQ